MDGQAHYSHPNWTWFQARNNVHWKGAKNKVISEWNIHIYVYTMKYPRHLYSLRLLVFLHLARCRMEQLCYTEVNTEVAFSWISLCWLLNRGLLYYACRYVHRHPISTLWIWPLIVKVTGYIMGRCQQFNLTNSEVLHDTRVQLQNMEHDKRDPQCVLHSKNWCELVWVVCIHSQTICKLLSQILLIRTIESDEWYSRSTVFKRARGSIFCKCCLVFEK